MLMLPLLTQPEKRRSRAALADSAPGMAPSRLISSRYRFDSAIARVAVLRAVHAEDQQPLVVDPERLPLEVAEAFHEQRRAHQEHQRQRDLHDHEDGGPEPGRGMLRADRARAGLLHRRQQLDARGEDRGREAEEDRRRGRDRRGEPERREVHLRRQQRPSIGRHEQHQRARGPTGAEDAENPAGGRHQQTFRQQLADETRPAGAEREAKRELPPPRHRARQEEHGDVRARDQQHEPDHPHHQVEGFAVGAPQLIEAAAARLEPDVRRVLAIDLGQRVGHELLEDAIDSRPRLALADSRLQPRHHLRPPIAAGLEQRRRAGRAEPPRHQLHHVEHRHVDVGRSSGLHAEKGGRRDADDGEGHVVDGDRLAD